MELAAWVAGKHLGLKFSEGKQRIMQAAQHSSDFPAASFLVGMYSGVSAAVARMLCYHAACK